MEQQQKPSHYTALVTAKEQLSAKVYRLVCQWQNASQMTFQPGQFINIDVAPGVTRQYSIASSPSHTDQIELLVDVAPGGPGSQYFMKLEAGQTITCVGPMGKFTLVSEEGNIIFLAASTGIAPFRAMIDYVIEQQNQTNDFAKRNIFLYQSFRYEQDIFWRDYFELLETQVPNFHFLLTLSQPNPEWNGCGGYVQACMDKQLLKNPASRFYVCGGTRMVEGVVAYLRENQVPEDKIHFEPF
ncbi:hypothetical protein HY468_02110 [Candidatus Roizmanbacteria bacterium]|nr:hypothetical protein [Candidatus Roizmanbacteria bacterium]